LSLAVKFGSKKGDARDIPTRLAERAHEALTEHVIGESQNWDACSGPPSGANCCISCR
jgi:hypothetical protein